MEMLNSNAMSFKEFS